MCIRGCSPAERFGDTFRIPVPLRPFALVSLKRSMPFGFYLRHLRNLRSNPLPSETPWSIRGSPLGDHRSQQRRIGTLRLRRFFAVMTGTGRQKAQDAQKAGRTIRVYPRPSVVVPELEDSESLREIPAVADRGYSEPIP
ncbi:MAG: hypothetical protein ACKPB0_08005, partial [Opitutaceae bacterium]